jgi:hypothetical protein
MYGFPRHPSVIFSNDVISLVVPADSEDGCTVKYEV